MNLKVSKTELIIAFCLIPFFTYAIGYKWPHLGILVYIGRYAVLLLMIAKCIMYNRYKYLIGEKVFIACILFYVTIYISTIINGKNISDALQLSMYGILPFLIFGNYHDEVDRILGGINIAFTVLIMLNAIIMLIYPQGIYQTFSSGTVTYYYLFGAKNQMVAPLLVGMCFFIEQAYSKNRRITMSAMLKCFICAGELIVGGSGTGIATIVILVAILFYQYTKRKNIDPTLSIMSVPFLFFVIVVFRMQNIFAFFIEGILHKSLDLTNRTYIWDTALMSIISHPLMGTGVSESMAGSVDLKLDYTERITFAHDAYLDVLLIGGIVAMMFFILIFAFLLQQYKRTELMNTKSIIWGGLVVYLIASVFDIYTGNYCMFLIIAYIMVKGQTMNPQFYIQRGENDAKN